MNRQEIFDAISKERDYQNGKWGTAFDDRNTPNDWIAYINKYLGQSVLLSFDRKEFEKQLIKVATLCIAAIETLDRNNGQIAKRHYDKG